MHFIVRSFRSVFVEGRFTPLLASLGMIAMRAALYYVEGLPQIPSGGYNYLWKPIAPFFGNPRLSLLGSTLSVFLIAWLLSLLNGRFNLLRSRSNLPFIVPLFLLSLHPYFLVMSGDYISIIFILLALFLLLESYQKPDSYLSSFRMAILIGMASLFQIYALILLPCWWIGERSMRSFRLQSFISSLFGLFLIYVTLFSIYWFLDDIPGFIAPFFAFPAISLPKIPLFSALEWGGVVFTGLFFISNMTLCIRTYNRDKALTISLIRFEIFLILLLLFFQIIYWQETLFFLLISITLISCLNAYFYSKTMSKSHIYLAYGMLVCMFFIYFSHLIASAVTLL